MTTGSRSMGSDNSYGAISSKVWSGTDWSSREKPVRWPPLSIVDDNGQAILKDSPAYHAGVIRARAAAIRAGRAKSKRLQTEDHAYSCSWTSHVNGKLFFRNGSTTYEYPHFSMFGKAGVSYGWTANDDIKLVNKLRQSLQGSDFNLGVFLAEAPMAVQMIGDAALRIAESIRYARRGNFREAARTISKYQRFMGRRDVSASNLLELQYGWLPLMGDMRDGAEFLAHQLYHSPQHVVKVSRRVMGTVIDPLVGVGDESYAFTRKSIIARITEVDQVKLVGVTDPASIIWEMIPGSFLLDWSIPIGDFLAARGVSNSLQGTFVTTRVDRYYWKPRNDPFYYNGRWWYGAKSSFASGGSMGRSVSSGLNVPLPEFKPLAKIASWQHALNGVAVLQQVASSPFRWHKL